MSGPSFEGTTLDAVSSGTSDFAVAAAATDDAWSAPAPAVPVPESDASDDSSNVAEEVARLEALLAERARVAQDQKSQLQHAQRLLRAAAVSFERSVSSAPDPAALTRQRDAAVARAIEAEAARAEFAFRLDELRGYLTEAAAPAPNRVAAAAVAELEAKLRALSSQLAASAEARGGAEARLVLAEQDLGILRGRAHALEREVAEAREQIEFEAMRARGLEQQLQGSLSARQGAELRGELAGARARRDEGESVARALVAELESARAAQRDARASSDERATEIQSLKRGLEQETETAREAADKLARALAECVVLREQLAQAQARPEALPQAEHAQVEVDAGAAQRGVAEQRGRADRMRDALREARHVLGELAGSLERTVKTMPPVAKAPSDDAAGSEQPTTPGMPTYIEAMEGLEELVALRDEHIRDLTTKLQLERDRVRAVERGLTALQGGGVVPQSQWAELIALVKSR